MVKFEIEVRIFPDEIVFDIQKTRNSRHLLISNNGA